MSVLQSGTVQTFCNAFERRHTRAPSSTRRITCGRPACRCHNDPEARHGPYHYWTRKARGKNNRELERLVKEMRRISSRVLALITGRQAP